MKITISVLTVLFMLIGISSARQIPAPKKLPPPLAQPDLSVTEIAFGNNTGPSNVRVDILNQGKASSTECYLALISSKPMPSGQTEQRTWSVKVPSIPAGKSRSLRFKVTPLTETDGPWKAIVDRSNTVKESNENNNELVH